MRSHLYNTQDQINKIKPNSKLSYSKNEKNGKIFINDLWSEKYSKMILCESKIQNNIEKIDKLHRRNIEDFMEEMKQMQPTSSVKQICDQIIDSYMTAQHEATTQK